MPFTDDEVRQIIEAIERSDWDEVRLVAEDLTLLVSKSGEVTLALDGAEAPPGPAAESASVEPAPAAPPAEHRRRSPAPAIEVFDEAHAETAHPPAATQHRDLTTVGAPSLGFSFPRGCRRDAFSCASERDRGQSGTS